jgi:hypothetical protein
MFENYALQGDKISGKSGNCRVDKLLALCVIPLKVEDHGVIVMYFLRHFSLSTIPFTHSMLSPISRDN